MTFKSVAAVFAGLSLAATASATDISLSPGFTPDPHNVSITSGGTNDASTWSSGCNGWVADRGSADIDLTWNGAGTLHISVTSGSDTTLVVNDANGRWWCNDDAQGTNPGLTIPNASAGLIEIWVGSYEQGTYNSTNVQISEIGQFQ